MNKRINKKNTIEEIHMCPHIRNKKEDIYIIKRKIKAMFNSLCFYICRIFPIKKKLISVCTFEGKGGFGCNPKYIVEELHKQRPDAEFVWFVNDDIFDKKEFPNYIKKVRNTLLNRAYWLTRSKVWIDNYRKPYGTVKRKGQYYINVNHYTIGIKCTGLWRGDGFSKMAYLVSKNDSDMVDMLVTDSEWTKEVSPKGFVYTGEFLNTGAPRCDVLFGDRTIYKRKFREKHNIPIDANVILFAPTFREGAKNGKRYVFSEIWTVDFERLINNFEKRFGGEWYLCVRVHPQLAPTFEDYKNDKIQARLINESQAEDMYEILAGMDAYISDYSSAIFEAGFAHIPAFVYADDIEKYANDRGALMWNLATDPYDNVSNNKDITPEFDVKFPFSIATNNDELEKNILEFDEKIYDAKLDTFHRTVELVFEGNASEKVCKYVEKCM